MIRSLANAKFLMILQTPMTGYENDGKSQY